MHRTWFAAALSASLALGAALPAPAGEKKPTTEFTFGQLRAATPEAAKAQAETWLKSTGKMDQKAFDAVWADPNTAVLDKVAETLKIGSPEAARILDESAKADMNAPHEVPALIKNANRNDNAFFRANLALAFARNLVAARVYEEALEALETIRAEEVIDPSAYLFHKAVVEHALMKRDKAIQTIFRLLNHVSDAPDRYSTVTRIMLVDMLSWNTDEKDLGNIVKLMENSGRRLDLSRPGKVTQDIQKRIVFRLEELIKELENKDGAGQPNNGGEGDAPGGSNQPKEGMKEDKIATNKGAGNVDDKRIGDYSKIWGKLPPHERARAIQELTRDVPPRYRLMIEDYFKSLNKSTQQP